MPNIRSNHCYCRQDGPAQQVNPIKRPAIPVLPFPLDQSLNGEQFLLNDSSAGDISRILVFPKNQAVRLLANYINVFFPNYTHYSQIKHNRTIIDFYRRYQTGYKQQND